MHITIDRELLQKYITQADRVTGKNLSLPILGNILLVAQNKSLIIRATNLEVGVEFHIPSETKKEGVIALNGSLFANILNGIPDEKILTFIVENNICTITTKSKHLTIKGVNTDDFPTIPVIQTNNTYTLPTQQFIQNIRLVTGSAATSDIKPEIASVFIKKDNNQLIFAATDSFRLTEKRMPFKGEFEAHGVIIPIKNINEIIRILENTQEEVVVKTTKTQISFTTKTTYLVSRVIQGVYPDYPQIIPKEHSTELTILKQDFLNTLKLSNIFSDTFNKVALSVNPEKKQCVIATKNTEIGEAESNIDAVISGDPILISLNGKHLLDAVTTIENDSITLQCSGSNKPAVIRGFGDQSFTYLTMPLTR